MSFGFAEHLFCDKKLFYLSHKCQHFCHLSICICEHCACICIINIYVCIKIHKYICMYICLAYLSNSFAGNIHRTWGPKDFEMSTFFCIAKCLRKTSKNEKNNKKKRKEPASFYLLPYFMWQFYLLFSFALHLFQLVVAVVVVSFGLSQTHWHEKHTHTHAHTHAKRTGDTEEPFAYVLLSVCLCVLCVCVTCFSCLLFFYLFYYFFTFSYFLRCILRFFAVARLC